MQILQLSIILAMAASALASATCNKPGVGHANRFFGTCYDGPNQKDCDKRAPCTTNNLACDMRGFPGGGARCQ
ncbi:unnamed protein product [Zymoseptoria tritici ST99CH_3D1]|uniref:Uncharacterized protein n=1 Tax=Zymoseptoria tritici (strain ST99CH_3D7) TaxID=1276538 RepID=A0A1X7S9I0_ZYMT9|nr:unnamed protein product [Zymoseptoria tritici ST99CH_3D7]SMR64662.1 unnamed protein product [Zymoseptoria tritici ST99CH_3D1]